MNETLEYIGEEAVAADSAALVAGLSGVLADSLSEQGAGREWQSRFQLGYRLPPDLYSAPDGPFLMADSASEIFGVGSRLETLSVPSGRPRPNLDMDPEGLRLNTLFLDGLTVILFLFFFLHLFLHRASIGQIFRSVFMLRQFDKLVEGHGVTFRIFLRSSSLLCFLSMLVIGLKWGLIWVAAPSEITLPVELIPFLLPILVGVLLAIWIYKRTITGIIAMLSGKSGQMDGIQFFSRFYTAIVSCFLAPAALLTGLTDPEQVRWVFVFQVIVLIILLLYYFFKSFSFFVSRKISILQWFLYLCAVEIWPVSFFFLFALRGFVW